MALASHLLLDGFKGAYDAAAILSNDSDLIEPVRMVKAELGLPTVCCHPCRTRPRNSGQPQASCGM